MTQNLPATRAEQSPAEVMETVLIKGDLARLTVEERNTYYFKLCESVGLNPLTQPIEYINLNGKLRLYAKKDCTDQLRAIHNVSVTEMTETERDSVFMVTCKVANAAGRTDIAKGAVNIASLKGEALANALMKAETKAKRRATLSICGLGILDETEVEDIPAAQRGSGTAAPTRAAVPSPSAASQPAQPQAATYVPPTKPCAIERAEGETVNGWARRYIAAFLTAKTDDEMVAWDKQNSETLDAIYEKAKDTVFSEIMTAYEKHRDAIKAAAPEPTARPKPTAAKADPITTGPQPVQKAYPDPKTDYEAYLKFVEDGINGAADIDALNAFYETNVEPEEASLFPPDRSEVAGWHDKASRRFEP